MTIQTISSPALPEPVGPFSPAVRSDPGTFLSGQVGQDPATGAIVAGGVEAETRQIFANLAQLLEAADRTFADALRVGVYLTDMADFAAVNAIYAEHFTEPFPARTCIEVRGLPLGASVEIDVVLT